MGVKFLSEITGSGEHPDGREISVQNNWERQASGRVEHLFYGTFIQKNIHHFTRIFSNNRY